MNESIHLMGQKKTNFVLNANKIVQFHPLVQNEELDVTFLERNTREEEYLHHQTNLCNNQMNL